MALKGLVFVAELIIHNPDICNEADEHRPVRSSNLPCEGVTFHNRMLQCAGRKGIANDEAGHLVLERLG